MLLRHVNLAFSDQVVYLTGHAYERCRFTRCTFVVQGTGNTALVACDFVACVWHLDIILHDEQQVQDFEENLLPMIRASVPVPPAEATGEEDDAVSADEAGAVPPRVEAP